jgi:hypothetical protein
MKRKLVVLSGLVFGGALAVNAPGWSQAKPGDPGPTIPGPQQPSPGSVVQPSPHGMQPRGQQQREFPPDPPKEKGTLGTQSGQAPTTTLPEGTKTLPGASGQPTQRQGEFSTETQKGSGQASGPTTLPGLTGPSAIESQPSSPG